MPENWETAGFGIYVHWPFCEAKCPYCDFNSHVVARVDHDRWRRAYLSEIERYGTEIPDREVTSIFFGGGTPSLMDPGTVASIIEAIGTTWRMSDDVEITLEANPSSVEADRFRDFKSAGVNRVSLGVQALNDHDLKRLGRMHSSSEALDALHTARSLFSRVSFDLIYARQNQTLDAWRNELTRALSFDTDHLSLYQLTIEDGTAFGDRYKRGTLRGLPDDDLSADLYEMTNDMCDAAGRPMYEVSNYAAPGQQSAHNLIYWRYGDYVGLGPGAHGRLSDADGIRHATEAVRAPGAWLQAVEAGAEQEERTRLSPDDQALELLVMGLRLVDGVSLARFNALSSKPITDAKVCELSGFGYIRFVDEKLIVENQYFSLLNTVMAALLDD